MFVYVCRCAVYAAPALLPFSLSLLPAPWHSLMPEAQDLAFLHEVSLVGCLLGHAWVLGWVCTVLFRRVGSVGSWCTAAALLNKDVDDTTAAAAAAAATMQPA
jgi:hypothetical protein